MTVLNDLVTEILAAEKTDSWERQHAAFSALVDHVYDARKDWFKDGYEMGKRHGSFLKNSPLADKVIDELAPVWQNGWTLAEYTRWVARAVERAHGIK